MTTGMLRKWICWGNTHVLPWKNYLQPMKTNDSIKLKIRIYLSQDINWQQIRIPHSKDFYRHLQIALNVIFSAVLHKKKMYNIHFYILYLFSPATSHVMLNCSYPFGAITPTCEFQTQTLGSHQVLDTTVWLNAVWEFTCSEKEKGNNSYSPGQFFYSTSSSREASWLQPSCSTPWCSPQLAATQTKGPVGAQRILSSLTHQHMHLRCHMQVSKHGIKHAVRTQPTEHVELEPDKCFCIPLLRHSHSNQKHSPTLPKIWVSVMLIL